MKMFNMKKTHFTMLAALVLVLALSVGGTLAYFTATDEAAGSMTLTVKPIPEIHEEIEDDTNKVITISNDEEAADCAVRVQVFYPSLEGLEVSIEGEGWTQEGDWYVYQSPLAGGETTSALKASVYIKEAELPDDFEITVVYEATPVIYDENGDFAPDWTAMITTE